MGSWPRSSAQAEIALSRWNRKEHTMRRVHAPAASATCRSPRRLRGAREPCIAHARSERHGSAPRTRAPTRRARSTLRRRRGKLDALQLRVENLDRVALLELLEVVVEIALERHARLAFHS